MLTRRDPSLFWRVALLLPVAMFLVLHLAVVTLAASSANVTRLFRFLLVGFDGLK